MLEQTFRDLCHTWETQVQKLKDRALGTMMAYTQMPDCHEDMARRSLSLAAAVLVAEYEDTEKKFREAISEFVQ